MTQPPQFDYYTPAAYSDSLAPARRASVLLFILGTVLAGFGLCNIVSTTAVSSQEMIEMQQKFIPKDQALPVSPETYKTIAIAMQGAIVLVGLILLALGVPVRNGSSPATIIAIIVTGIILLLLILLALMSLIAAIVAPALAVMLCFLVVPIAGFSLQFVWLIQAARAASVAKTATQQYAAQYWQYYQQQQQQAPYAYGPYTPPMPPAPYPPPQYPPVPPQAPPPSASGDPHGNPPAQ
jgi:lysylphosphatidylglycerol synthetase-like protein (DUF2156 family)